MRIDKVRVARSVDLGSTWIDVDLTASRELKIYLYKTLEVDIRINHRVLSLRSLASLSHLDTEALTGYSDASLPLLMEGC